ncbi:branched-chain-amino-acid aminotransferase [Blyttiomyces sp. JEL0837]|nr:branched-chain-amino-acid aminotransferase [Blyttiomyces sp. JEL0837]
MFRSIAASIRIASRSATVSPIALATRFYSTPATLSCKSIEKSLTKNQKAVPANKDLVFGQTFSDHMLSIEWQASKGWAKPVIQPYGNISLAPSATVLHYAIECFEGMKAYKDKNGKIRMFRPDMNMKRLLRSCERLTLPSFEPTELLECIKELLRVDDRWIPSERGYSLYIRPTVIATQESLGVGPSSKALLFVITCPVGPYYKTGFAAVSLSATSHYVRAWPGGTGDAKIGGNYAPGIRPQIEVAKDGYQQNLWLFGEEEYITEVGTMNLFVLWKNKNGETELVTPPLDGTILPGVTRDSIISLAKTWNEFKVVERKVRMSEITEAIAEGRMKEMFGAGTAAIVSPIKNIKYNGKDWAIPLDPTEKSAQAGPFTRRLADYIMGVQYGEIEHSNWSVLVN